MMDHDLKMLWVDALESGDYKQGVGLLRGGSDLAPRHCCLGVLCEVLIQHPEFGIELQRNGDAYELRVPEEHEDSWIDGGYAACQEAGVGSRETFWNMNDQERKTFREIAQYLREHDTF